MKMFHRNGTGIIMMMISPKSKGDLHEELGKMLTREI